MIGIIGGSGFYKGLKDFEGSENYIETPYGKVRAIVGDDFMFIARHGYPPIPPHMVNYHANIYAFKVVGIKNIVAITAVGSLKEDIPPGTVLLPDDLLDFTGHVWTYYDDTPVHANMYEPFCPLLRKKLSSLGLPAGGVYATMKGPQFESHAEKNMLIKLGADVVGMTVAPEAKLAKELELCYQPVCMVVNFVDDKTTHQNTVEMAGRMEKYIAEILKKLIEEYPEI